MSMNRWQAFLTHLGIGVIVYLPLLYLIVFVWYPQPYFAADGGWQGLRIIAAVDLVLGPVLTLIVFKPGKPGLRRDLTIIATLQIVALVWGAWTVREQRIALVAFADSEFYTLSPEQVNDAGGKAPEIAAQGTTTPPYSFVRLPRDTRERQKLRMETMMSGKPPHIHGDLHEPLDQTNLPEVLAHSLNIDRYAERSDEYRQELEEFLARHDGKVEDYAFLPLHCRYSDLVLVISRADGRVVDSLRIVP